VVADVVAIVEGLAQIATRLLDFLIGIGVGVSQWLSGIDDVVAPFPAL
jgi:hypothetical protein